MASARFERDRDVGVVVIDQPPLNLFGDEMFRDLDAAVREAERSDIRGLLIRAEGKYFTGGVDVHFFDDKTPEQMTEAFDGWVGLVHRLEDMPIPTMSSVQGLCLTAGLELSLGCDLIFAAESARFGLVETVIGLTPAMGGTQRMAERAGPARAREFVMSGDIYAAATLEGWNVVNRVVPGHRLAEESMEFMQRLAAGPTKAHAATKAMVRAFLHHGVRGADERIGSIAAPLFDTADLKNAVKTFLAEGPGKATFEGR
ncbi:MAG: enoyl-CoA hydratase/isomerase family protein [Thermoleophilaceae bacterium]